MYAESRDKDGGFLIIFGVSLSSTGVKLCCGVSCSGYWSGLPLLS